MSYQPPLNPRSRSIDKPTKAVPDTCYRCGGGGGSTAWPGWTCFRCGGSGQDPSYKVWVFPTDWTDEQIETFHAEREARNLRARERAYAKRQEEADEVLNRNLATYPELVPIFERDRIERIPDTFVSDVLSKIRHFPLSSAQAVAVIKAVADLDAETARLEAIPELPEGTYTVVGRVVSTKWVDSQWGGQLKMLVELDTGQRVFGTVASAISDLDADDRVSFDATVTRSDDDRIFGFFKRPRNAQILERANG